MPNLVQYIYTSRVAPRSILGNEAGVDALMSYSVARNTADKITGVLLVLPPVIIQLIEGPALAVDGAISRIRSDRRHTDFRVLGRVEVKARSFPDWSMSAQHLTESDARIHKALKALKAQYCMSLDYNQTHRFLRLLWESRTEIHVL